MPRDSVVNVPQYGSLLPSMIMAGLSGLKAGGGNDLPSAGILLPVERRLWPRMQKPVQARRNDGKW